MPSVKQKGKVVHSGYYLKRDLIQQCSLSLLENYIFFLTSAWKWGEGSFPGPPLPFSGRHYRISALNIIWFLLNPGSTKCEGNSDTNSVQGKKFPATPIVAADPSLNRKWSLRTMRMLVPTTACHSLLIFTYTVTSKYMQYKTFEQIN